MGSVKESTFKINPRFRLTTKYLSVVWHCVDKLTLDCEAALEIPDRFVFQDKNGVELLVQYHDGILDMIYHDSTDFETKKIQKWLRELIHDTILRIAKVVLPARVKYWENMKGLHGSGVTVKRLRKNVLAIARSTIILPCNRFSLYSNRNGLMVQYFMKWRITSTNIIANHSGPFFPHSSARIQRWQKQKMI